jgi:NAD(P)-dependent dehydrogenase (short-subunit alcohol dehydrogenase family)
LTIKYKNSFNFSGKIVLITGGASGIGKEFAYAFSECGAKVIIADIDIEKAELVTHELIRENRIAKPVRVDISSTKDIYRMVCSLVEEFGQIDILLNNAGVNIRKLAIEYNEDEWNRIIDINLKGAFFVAQEVAKKMMESGGGKIINTASDDAEIGHSTLSIYSASKAGLVSLTKVLAKEWAKYKINVNAIGPGYLLTELTKSLLSNKEKYDFILNEIPMGRLGTPEDIAGVALFLASRLSDYITGQTIYVEGGRLIH